MAESRELTHQSARDRAGIDVVNDVLEGALGPPPPRSDRLGALARARTDAAWVADLTKLSRYESALRTIRGPDDRGPWIEIYRSAGGGYEGLQAIAEAALDAAALHGYGPADHDQRKGSSHA